MPNPYLRAWFQVWHRPDQYARGSVTTVAKIRALYTNLFLWAWLNPALPYIRSGSKWVPSPLFELTFEERIGPLSTCVANTRRRITARRCPTTPGQSQRAHPPPRARGYSSVTSLQQHIPKGVDSGTDQRAIGRIGLSQTEQRKARSVCSCFDRPEARRQCTPLPTGVAAGRSPPNRPAATPVGSKATPPYSPPHPHSPLSTIQVPCHLLTLHPPHIAPPDPFAGLARFQPHHYDW